ncbi:MAG TPA: hypothetical protein VM941_08680 [Pyrinomonadaceae bacterium]|jgi:hypothetical protein|nr:hypothetical protein [Pyrinomonadaceae bacterium]
MAKTAVWTVMVYLAGNDNLTTERVFALTEIKQAPMGNTDTGSPVTFYNFISFCLEREAQRRATRISQTAALALSLLLGRFHNSGPVRLKKRALAHSERENHFGRNRACGRLVSARFGSFSPAKATRHR